MICAVVCIPSASTTAQSAVIDTSFLRDYLTTDRNNGSLPLPQQVHVPPTPPDNLLPPFDKFHPSPCSNTVLCAARPALFPHSNTGLCAATPIPCPQSTTTASGQTVSNQLLTRYAPGCHWLPYDDRCTSFRCSY